MAELGTLIGTTAASVSRYELGQRTPGIETLKMIAAALDVDVLQLMGFKDDNGNTTFATVNPLDIEKITREAISAGNDLLYLASYSGENDTQRKIQDALDKLNDAGQQKAVERVEELTEIPKYRKETPPQD